LAFPAGEAVVAFAAVVVALPLTILVLGLHLPAEVEAVAAALVLLSEAVGVVVAADTEASVLRILYNPPLHQSGFHCG
jgi:hypothetical protein